MHGPKVQCREIAESDVEAVAGLLTRGFPGRTHAYWMRAVKDGFVSDLRAEKPLTIEP